MVRLLIAAVLMVATAFLELRSAPVRARTDIDLSGFSCSDIAVSQLLKRVCYEPEHHYLLAEVGGRYYAHCNIDESVVDDLFEAESLQTFYITEIRAGHRCNKSDLPANIVSALAH